MKKTYYSILEIEENATQEEITKAFRRLAKKYHPDNIYTGNKEKFEEVMKAYDILSDLEKRRNYDRSLRGNDTAFGSSSNNQYTSYAKTREESERDMDNLMKDILRKYRQSQKSSQKEEFIHVGNFNINLSEYYALLDHLGRKQECEQKEDNSILKKTLRK